jgi:hypothetical protein
MPNIEQSTLEESGQEILSLIKSVLADLGPEWKIGESEVTHYGFADRIAVKIQRTVEGTLQTDSLNLSYWRAVRK